VAADNRYELHKTAEEISLFLSLLTYKCSRVDIYILLLYRCEEVSTITVPASINLIYVIDPFN
jgi:hypothetical protein